MAYTPKTIKRALKRCINEISEHPKVFSRNPEKDFTRVRKLPFKQVIKSVLSMTGKSLSGELMEYFNLNPSMTLPQQDEFDISVCFGLTRQRTKQVRDSDLKIISHTSPFDYLPQTSRKSIVMQPYYLSFRVVRFKLTEDTYEVLLTNLTEDEFSVSELRELYALGY